MSSRQHRLPKTQARVYDAMLGLVPKIRAHYGDSQPDGTNDFFVAEYKVRNALPPLVKGALRQARRYLLEGDSRIPIAILHEVGTAYTQDVVLIALSDFKRLLARLQTEAYPQPRR